MDSRRIFETPHQEIHVSLIYYLFDKLIVVAGYGHSQPQRSHSCIISLLEENGISDVGEWATGTLTHWTKATAETAASITGVDSDIEFGIRSGTQIDNTIGPKVVRSQRQRRFTFRPCQSSIFSHPYIDNRQIAVRVAALAIRLAPGVPNP
ncbi:hypothetical protein EVAR_55154_1 [Eumeta japonica]|uniref:Uncharacterized protein n=1 Tax=Eumeta variegata TaxID=151549 RepID=A0A4C1Y782_EUMVA|nr:hypothetical protein EVAR_55154_1 [Eumeta japonica]